ncbi:MAG: pentapeptide repeat-containing protein [Reyranellales bacterium]
MPDKIHLAMLKSGASAWSVWRTAHADVRPELSGAHLHGLDLVGVNLTGADLRMADLRGTDLSNAVLIGADLEGANFFRAVLNRTDLAGCNLIGAQFLQCAQLMAARNWQSAFRDMNLACGAAIPPGRFAATYH